MGSDAKYDGVICLFDVDGTLTYPRQVGFFQRFF